MGEQGSSGGEKTELRALVFGVQTRWKLFFFLSGACLSSLLGMNVGSEMGGQAQRE